MVTGVGEMNVPDGRGLKPAAEGGGQRGNRDGEMNVPDERD
jgi:hypothetical protein